jgi:hypothetical protein
MQIVRLQSADPMSAIVRTCVRFEGSGSPGLPTFVHIEMVARMHRIGFDMLQHVGFSSAQRTKLLRGNLYSSETYLVGCLGVTTP